MSSYVRYTLFGFIVVVSLFLAGTISWSPAFKGTVVDAHGSPSKGAFVLYHYSGGKFIHGSYQKSGGIVVTGDDGRFEIPLKVHFHRIYPLQEAPELVIDLVYSPEVHAVVVPSRPRKLFVADEQGRISKIDPQAGAIVLTDVRESPALWYRMLQMLLSSLEDENDDHLHSGATLAVKHDLFVAALNDVQQFKERYAELPFDSPNRSWVVGRETFGDHLDQELLPLKEFAESIGAKAEFPKDDLRLAGRYFPKTPEEAVTRCITNLHQALVNYAVNEPLLAGIEAVQPEWNRLRFESTIGEESCLVYLHFTVIPTGGTYSLFDADGEPQNFVHLGVTGHKKVVVKKKKGQSEEMQKLIQAHVRTMMEDFDHLHAKP